MIKTNRSILLAGGFFGLMAISCWFGLGKNSLLEFPNVTNVDENEDMAIVYLMSPNWDGAGDDFLSVGISIRDMALWQRKKNAKRMVFHAYYPMVDKYGNEANPNQFMTFVLNAGLLQKINFEYNRNTIFSHGEITQMSRTGRKMAQAFCRERAVKEARFCSSL